MAIQLIDRREMMRIGGLTLGGLGLADLVKAAPAPSKLGTSFGRAKNIIFLYLCGGPPQHETFDPKPDAPTEIRAIQSDSNEYSRDPIFQLLLEQLHG